MMSCYDTDDAVDTLKQHDKAVGCMLVYGDFRVLRSLEKLHFFKEKA